MAPQTLDHVALYVTDPDAVAACILSQLPFRVIEETDEFVLIGRDPQLGKLTLFRAEGARDAGSLREIGIGIPCATLERTVEVGEGLRLNLVPGEPDGEVDLGFVALNVPDPDASAQAWLDLGFAPASDACSGARRVRVGSHHVELHAGIPASSERPLLNHLGVLVESLDDAHRTIEEHDLVVEKEVDAEMSRAVFVHAPDGVSLEYIEHKPAFATA